jgi:hypothetical protein
MRTSLILVVVILIALAWFNPGMADFKRFVETESERLLLQEVGDGALGRVLSDVGSSLAGSYIDRVTERDNYVFFSRYTIDLDGADAEGEEWRFLGIAGRFIEMEQPASVGERREAP